MKKLLLSAVLVALTAAPAMSLADVAVAPDEASAPAHHDAAHASDRNADPSGDDATSYAEREQAASPELQQYAGGADGVYITTGAIVVALLIVLLIATL